MTSTTFDYAVVGAGMMGAAAGRYLSATGGRVALIGPTEPPDWSAHAGVFASHYDQGRITRILDQDPVWAILAKRSLAQYPTIEAQSGIRFHHPVGGWHVAPTKAPAVGQLEAVGRETGATFNRYPEPALSEVSRPYAFQPGAAGVLEAGGAGYIQPRALVQAQVTMARQQGAEIITETAGKLSKQGRLVEIETVEGQTYQAHKVLIAAGGFTNHLLTRPLDLRVRPLTVLLAELDSAEVDRLQGMPTLIYHLPHPLNAIPNIYLLPPIQYPDGKFYLKLGGSRRPYTYLSTHAERCAWFHTAGNPTEGEALHEILLATLPDLKIETMQTKPCLTAYTPHNHPFIDVLEPDQLYVAAGGCGSAAKSSDAIGQLAARLLQAGRWDDDQLPGEAFRAIYRGEGESL